MTNRVRPDDYYIQDGYQRKGKCGMNPVLICPSPSLSCSESEDMVFEEFKRAYLKGVVYGDDDESPTEA